MRRSVVRIAFALSALALATPAMPAGFSIFEQGTKAMGMGGAFTAQADDPSALFHNVGGLGFFTEQEWAAGVTLIRADSSFTGLAPFPGPTATGEQDDGIASPPPIHAYWVRPFSGSLNFGFGVNAPFGLATEWNNPDEWPGRFLSTRAALQSIDLNPSLGWRSASGKFGAGFGLIGRFAQVDLERRAAVLNPFILSSVEVAKVELESDWESGLGWNVGILHKVNNSFSWGFSYRSTVDVDFGGNARLTQVPTGIPAFDGVIAATLPFDQNLPIKTNIEFPDIASFGLAFALTPSLVLETDFNVTGWSTFDEVVIEFTENPELSSRLEQRWDDSNHYRLGLNWMAPSGNEWRFGVYTDESPQPDETVGPLLPDADRIGISIGYGHRGPKYAFDVAVLYVDFDSRTTTTQRDGFFGTYETDVLLIGFTLGSS